MIDLLHEAKQELELVLIYKNIKVFSVHSNELLIVLSYSSCALLPVNELTIIL